MISREELNDVNRDGAEMYSITKQMLDKASQTLMLRQLLWRLKPFCELKISHSSRVNKQTIDIEKCQEAKNRFLDFLQDLLKGYVPSGGHPCRRDR